MANRLFRIKKEATRPWLVVNLKNLSDGSAVDFTGSSIKFSMRAVDGSLKIDEATAEIVGEATDGQMRYKFTLSDSDTPGDYEGEFKIIYPDDSVLKIPVSDEFHDKLKIKISEDVD